MLPKKQLQSPQGDRVIRRSASQRRSGWCCGNQNCTANKKGLHPSFTEAVFCGWETSPIQDIASILTDLGKVTVDDFERAETEQLLKLLQGVVAANILYLGKECEQMDRDFAKRELAALGSIQAELTLHSGRIWDFLQNAMEMFRSLLANPKN